MRTFLLTIGSIAFFLSRRRHLSNACFLRQADTTAAFLSTIERNVHPSRKSASLTKKRRRGVFSSCSSYFQSQKDSSNNGDTNGHEKNSGRSNLLLTVPQLQNDYFVLRHGQSEANVAGVIASNPDKACTNFGLSPNGHQQAEEAARCVVEHYYQKKNVPYSGLLILSSDFLRAKETAEHVVKAATAGKHADILYKNGVVLEERLRERWFGDWDGGSDDGYNQVWKDDAINDEHCTAGVESAAEVMKRATACVSEWDRVVQNHMVVCVAHGDVLQILQAAFLAKPASQHRSVQHLNTATLRRLVLKKM